MSEMDEARKARFSKILQPPQRLEDQNVQDKLAGLQAGATGENMTFGAPVPSKPRYRGPVVQPNLVTQEESDKIRAAQKSLLTGAKVPYEDTAAGQQNDKLDWLENAAQFDDQDAKDQLKKLAPDRFNKLFGQ
jgi:hypothetical protein